MGIDYESIFKQYGGIMRTCELTKEGISYQQLQNLIEAGSVEKIKYGYYQWQDEKAFTEVSVITSLFPEAIICDVSAAVYYGYTDRVPGILKRMTASSRMKDFFDIFYWSQVFDFEGRVLQEAIFETLQHRGTLYERDSLEQIKAFNKNEFLQNLWSNYNPGSGLEKPDFTSVLAQIERFIGPVYEAILQEDEFFGMWSSKENVWKNLI